MVTKMHLRDIMMLPTVESARGGPYMAMEETVGDIVFGTLAYMNPNNKLLADMHEHGQRYPIVVGLAEDVCGHYGVDPLGFEGELVAGDGMHRVRAAAALGWQTMNVTDDPEESGRADQSQWGSTHR